MTARSNTLENLSIISDRNEGRRKSLGLIDDYNNDSPNETGTDSEQVPEKVVKSSDSSLVQDLETNLRKRDKPSKLLTVVNLDSDLDSRPLLDLEEIQATDSDHKQIFKKFKELKNYNLSRLNKRPKDGEDDKYKSRFGDIKFYIHSTTIFDAPYFKKSQFFGCYVLFWLGTAFLMFNSLIHSYFEHSEWIFNSPIINIMKKDLFKVGLTDLAMYLTTYVSFFIQYMCLKGWISWASTGSTIQLIYDFFHLLFWLVFASDHVKGFPWIAKVFLVLHNFVFLMKMHSYGFYNGYLWSVLEELKESERLLKKIDSGKSIVPQGMDKDHARKILIDSITFCKFELEYQSLATSLSTDVTVDPKDIDENIEDLQKKSIVKFPGNINLFNYFEYTMFPTVVYTLNFPRTPRIRRRYLFEKIVGTFGIIFLMILVAQNSLYPLVIEALNARTLPLDGKIKAYLFILLDMIPPFLLIYLLTFFLIWDAILNSIAELSRFADRDFYGPWWSCTDWSEYARIWNRPVHKFLLRHVYHSSISAFSMNKLSATMFTFILSSLLHELVMFVIFGKLRGYLLVLQMSQIPLVMISRTKYLKDKKVLGNVICWFGFISGPSMLCTLYLIF